MRASPLGWLFLGKKMFIRDSQQAFRNAIATEKLSGIPGTHNYAALYMYMGSEPQVGTEDQWTDLFKHIETREYLRVAS